MSYWGALGAACVAALLLDVTGFQPNANFALAVALLALIDTTRGK